MKTLYIHIGTPKTGTTSLQTFCKVNAEALEKKGYAYPVFPYSYPNVSMARNGHFLVGMIKNEEGKRCKKEEKRIYREGMEIVRNLFQRVDSVILSDETIWRAMDAEKKNLWKNIKKDADNGNFAVKIIVYLRRQDKLICSLWNQNIKKVVGSRGEEQFEDFLERIDKDTRLDYYSKLEKIASVFGKENIAVRRFERDSFWGGNIYSDFLQAIGISDMEDLQMPQENKNPGLYGNTHEIKRILNGLPQKCDLEQDLFFRNVLMECSGVSADKFPCEMFSKEETQEFLAQYADGNRRIAEEYLGEEGADLFDNSVQDIPKWQRDNPYMQDDVIRFSGMSSIYLMEENRKLREEIRKLKEELDSFKYKIKHPFRTVGSMVLSKVRRAY